MLQTGIKGYQEMYVGEEDTAEKLKSGILHVFATPAMISLIEETAWRSVAKELEEGNTTVGTELNIKHLASTPVGMKVWCETSLTEVDKRRLVFSVEVFDEGGKIGEGTHERFIVAAEKFQQKTDKKRKVRE